MSAIDPTKPAAGNATTESVRANFQAAKTEIEALAGNVAVTKQAAWIYAGDDNAAAPVDGQIIIMPTGAVRHISINNLDADGQPHYMAPLLVGDTIIITNDPGSGAPTAFARYLITADPVDHGYFFAFVTKRTDTTGATAPPPIGTRLRVTGNVSATPQQAGDIFPPMVFPMAKNNLYNDAWQAVGTTRQDALIDGIVPMNMWTFHPFIAPHAGTIQEVRFYNSNSIEHPYRIAIARVKETDPYQPETLAFDTGEQNTPPQTFTSIPADFTVGKGEPLFLLMYADIDVPAKIYNPADQPILLLDDQGPIGQRYYAFGLEGAINTPIEEIGSMLMKPVNTPHLPFYYKYA